MHVRRLTGSNVHLTPSGWRGGINTYSYVGGNPISFADPYGLYCLSATQISAISGGVGGAVGGALSAAALGPAAAIASATVGAVVGAAVGAAGTPGSADQSAALGAAAAAGSGAPFFKSNGAGGVVGGALSYGMSSSGFNAPLSNVGGGYVGGAVGGAISAFAATAGGPSARSVVGGLNAGGWAGIAGSIAALAAESALKSGNDCGCGK